jgi:serine/threonine protein kinase
MNEKDIFYGAVEKQSPEERQAFLDGACGRDAALRHKVDQLLEEHFASDSLLLEPAVDRDATWEDAVQVSERPGAVIGHYKLLQKIGEGGFGVVYMAEQKEPIKRRVALKVIKLGMDTKQVVGRFEAERQALAMMDHMNIAKVLDAGATDSGRPFFVMELVKGIPITKYCDENLLTPEERLNLFIPVCQAIQHAHQKGVIHRDIKPSNIMITLHDGEPVPKVIDFGIAKATQQELTEKTVFTQYSQFIGTPAYMSPEQAEMSGLDIDTRSDVYSLGVLLYELLTGKTPLDGRELMSGGYDEIKRRIREEEPPKPSTKVSTMEGDEQTQIAKQRKVEPGKLSGRIRGDLDWIVMKALEKDRTRRYETANGLAADVGRFLRNEPVTAVAPTLSYQIHKFYLRNRSFVRLGIAVTLALTFATMISVWQAYEANAAKREVTAERDVAEAARRSEEQARLDAESAREKAEDSERAALAYAESERQQSYAADMNMVQRRLEQNNLGRARELLDRNRPEAGQVDLRGWEWRYLWGVTRGDHTGTLVKTPHIMAKIELSPDGRLVALAEEDSGHVSVWD